MRAAELALTLGALALGGCGTGCGTRALPPPSVVLVSIDTLRADHLGLYGYSRDTSPFLDRWAREATVFERAFTSCPWTLVAHMSMLTGLYPAQHGVTTPDLGLSEDIPMLAERLRRAGYQTLALYQPSWLNERFGFARGFDVYRPHGSAEEAEAHLREEFARLDPARPYFLFYHLFDVHNGPMSTGAHMLYPSPEPFQEMFLPGATEKLPKIPPDELWESRDLLDATQLEALVALYDGGVRHVDTRLAEAFGWLQEQGFLQDCLMIVTADHGEALGQRGRLDGHGELAQEGLHIPMIVRHPRGLAAGTRVREVVHLVDLVPTVLDVAGVKRDKSLPGRSLFGTLPPDRVLTGTFDPSSYVVQWPQKIIHGEGLGTVSIDLERDPKELHMKPVSEQVYQELLSQAFSQQTTFSPPQPLEAMSAEQRAELQDLGYAGPDE